MTVTNHAVGESIDLATVLNTKIEKPVLQSEMGLDSQANATKQAVRWDEFSLKHNNDGSFKGIDQGDLSLSSMANATKKAVRWDEFSLKHNNDGSFKGIDQADMSLSSAASATKKAVRFDEWTKRHNNDGTLKQIIYKKSTSSNPSATANTYGTAVDYSVTTNYSSLLPQAIDVVFGGTFGTETVTAQIVVTYSDATTSSITKTATATGTVSLTNTDIMSLIKDGLNITKLSVSSKSTIASSTTTVTFNHFGIQL